MRTLTVLTLLAAATVAAADDKGTVVELAGLKSTTPADWKVAEKPGAMRQNQFVLAKADGDTEDAELSVFVTPGQGGGIAANLDRQRAKFKPADGKDKVGETLDDKYKVGTHAGSYLDLKGTFLKKPFPMAQTGTPTPGYRMLYVIFPDDKNLNSVWLLGPEKTVEKHKKAFDEWVKNFK